MIVCGHRLEDTGKTVEVSGLCCGYESQAVYRCALGGECVAAGRYPNTRTCSTCTEPNRPPTFPTVKPLQHAPIRFTGRAAESGAYNCSLHGDDKSGFAFAFRSGWTSSDIRLCRLSDSFQPRGVMMPAFALHPRAPRGREDPRLFRFRDQWHFSFTGYEADRYFSSVLVAKVSRWPSVEKVWEPRYDQRNHPEKNWVFFDHNGTLHAVYRIAPEHRVLQFDGENVSKVHTSDWSPAWLWGEMRGGASPILHNGEWYSFFHGFRRSGGQVIYTCGLYTFENAAPFRPLRWIPTPLVVGGFSHQETQDGWKKQIYYPCGAALKNGRWYISAGEHDNRCTVTVFDADEIEAALTPVKVGLFSRSEIDTILSLNGWCDERKANRIAELVAAIPERVNGVEIGVFAGRSLFPAAVGARANPHGGCITGIDSYDAEENLRGIHGEEHRKFWTQSLVDDAKAEAFATREKLRLAGHCKIVVSKSADVADTVDNGLNYLHIDGNHSSAGAVLDAELYLPKMPIGGLVLVDDTKAGGKNDFFDGVMDAVSIVERFCDLTEDHGTWRVYKRVR